MQSWTEKLIVTKSIFRRRVRLVHSKSLENRRAQWHIILLDEDKENLYNEMLSTGEMDFTILGRTLYKGWGEKPPEEIVKAVRDKYIP